MVHLPAADTARFRALMDRFLPGWQETRKALNLAPPGRPYRGSGAGSEILRFAQGDEIKPTGSR